MNRSAKLQFIGPLMLSLMIVAEEAATYALTLKPSSIMAWYLNIEVFAIFQRAHYVLSNNFALPYFQLVVVATPILVLACAGLLLRRRLLLAAASNLSFVYVVFLGYAWHLVENPVSITASLESGRTFAALSWSVLTLTSGPQAFVLVFLLAPALLSFAVSHFCYLRAAGKT